MIHGSENLLNIWVAPDDKVAYVRVSQSVKIAIRDSELMLIVIR